MSELSLTQLRLCSICEVLKPASVDFFYANQGSLSAACRICLTLNARAYRNGQTVVKCKKKPKMGSARYCKRCLRIKPSNTFGKHFAEDGNTRIMCGDCKKAADHRRFGPPDSVKTCSKCGIEQPLEQFFPRPNIRCGYFPRCRTCHKAYYEANRERILKSQHEYNRKNAERRRERSKAYYHANREAMLEASRRWRAKNAERYKRQQREARRLYDQQFPEKRMERVRRYQARKLGTMVEPVSYEAILAEFGMVCHICEGEIESRSDLHFDHVIPLARGGAHVRENIKPSHARCNMSKGVRLL